MHKMAFYFRSSGTTCSKVVYKFLFIGTASSSLQSNDQHDQDSQSATLGSQEVGYSFDMRSRSVVEVEYGSPKSSKCTLKLAIGSKGELPCSFAYKPADPMQDFVAKARIIHRHTTKLEVRTRQVLFYSELVRK